MREFLNVYLSGEREGETFCSGGALAVSLVLTFSFPRDPGYSVFI